MKHLALATLLLCSAAAQAAEKYPGPYQAELVRVIDGDTIDMRVHLWPGIDYAGPVRLAGVNAPELRSAQGCERAAGAAAKAYMAGRLGHARGLVLRGVELDKYGRALARVEVDGRDLGAELILAGHARRYDGGRRGAWC